MTAENDETYQPLINREQTSASKSANSSIRQQLPAFFHFGSSLTSSTKKGDQQMYPIVSFEKSTEREQILDREFQSLDIDADGYVSIADLQSVLKLVFVAFERKSGIVFSLLTKLFRAYGFLFTLNC